MRHLRHLTRSPPATFPSAACPPPAARAGQAPCRLWAFVPAAPSLRLMRSAAPRVAARRRVPRRLPSTPRQRARLSVYFLPRACHLSASSPSVCVFVFLVLHRLFLPPECRLLEEGTRQACSKLDHQHLEQGLTLENAQYISDDGREGGREPPVADEMSAVHRVHTWRLGPPEVRGSPAFCLCRSPAPAGWRMAPKPTTAVPASTTMMTENLGD